MDIKKLTADEIEYLNYFIYAERHSCNIEPNLKDNFSFFNGYEWYFEETNSTLTKEFKKELSARLKSGKVDVIAIKKVNVFREYQKNIMKESDLFMSLFSYRRQQSTMQQNDFINDTIEKGNEFLRFAKERYNNFVENEMKIPTLENDHKLFLHQNIELVKKWIDWIKGNKDNLPKKGIDAVQLFTKLNENQPLLDTDILKIIIEQTNIKIDAEMKYFEQKYNTIHFFGNIFRTVTLFNAKVGYSINKDIQLKRELLMEMKIYEKELDSVLQTFTMQFYKVDANDINKLVITFKDILNFYKTVCWQFRYDLSKSYFYETLLKFENEYEAIVLKLLQLQNKGIEENTNVVELELSELNEAKPTIKEIIIDEIEGIEVNKSWDYVFLNKKNYNDFVELLGAYLSGYKYTIPNLKIELVSKRKTKFAKCMKRIYDRANPTTKPMHSDKKFYELLRFIKDYENDTDTHINKLMTRKD
jgi:hypothetical protein